MAKTQNRILGQFEVLKYLAMGLGMANVYKMIFQLNSKQLIHVLFFCRAVFTYDGKSNDLKVSETGGRSVG